MRGLFLAWVLCNGTVCLLAELANLFLHVFTMNPPWQWWQVDGIMTFLPPVLYLGLRAAIGMLRKP